MDITPDKKRLLDLVERARSGEIALPEFQRNFVWTRDDVRDLLTSVLPFPQPTSCPNPGCLVKAPPQKHGFYQRNVIAANFCGRILIRRYYVSEEDLTRELKTVKAENAPTEGQVRPGFGTYRGLLLVSTLTGGVQGRGDETGWLLAFKEGRLLGKMAVRLGTGEVTTYANGAAKHHRLPSPAARLLYPTEW